MPRYIDADEFMQRALGTKCFHNDYALMLTQLVSESTTISPDEVRGVGEWEDAQQHGLCRCSVCKDCYIEKDYITQAKWNYCPNCGARLGNGGTDDS